MAYEFCITKLKKIAYTVLEESIFFEIDLFETDYFRKRPEAYCSVKLVTSTLLRRTNDYEFYGTQYRERFVEGRNAWI